MKLTKERSNSSTFNKQVKNFILNAFESFSLKLLGKVSLINLYFDESFPDAVNGDKMTFLFVISTILSALMIDENHQKFELSFRCSFHSVKRSGYDLLFSFYFACSNQIADIFQQVFQQQSTYKRINTQGTIQMQILEFTFKKIRDLIQDHKVLYDTMETQLREEAQVRRVFQFHFNFDLTQSKAKDNNQNIQNIQLLDQSFARQALTPYHFQWKPKEVKAPVISIKGLKVQEEVQKMEEEKEQMLQLQRLLSEEKIQKDDMIVEEEEEDNVNEKLIIQQSIPKSLRDAMSIIIEHSVKEALKEQDLADICILESDESFMRLFSVSETGEQNEDLNTEFYASPQEQLKPFKQFHRKQKTLLRNVVLKQLKDIEIRQTEVHVQKLKEQQKLLSPQVLKRFQSSNVLKPSHHKKKSSGGGQFSSLKNISESSNQDESKNCSVIDYSSSKLTSAVLKNRMMTHFRKWSSNFEKQLSTADQ